MSDERADATDQAEPRASATVRRATITNRDRHSVVFSDADELSIDGFSFDDATSDRELAYCIWVHLETGDLSPTEGWVCLFERNPQDYRFLLLAVFEGWTHSPTDLLIAQFSNLAAHASAEVRQLLPALATHIEDCDPDAADQLRRAVGLAQGPVDAYDVLEAYQWRVLAELESTSRDHD